MLCILGSMHGFGWVVSVTLALQEMVCIFAIHLAFAKISKQAHKPAKWLLCANAHNQCQVGNFHGKLQLELQIARLHTTKRYGMSYGSFGTTVTMYAFVKVCL